ncbi:MAG: hypothetical protein AABY00_00020 [Nanoarchaeota archaeon]
MSLIDYLLGTKEIEILKEQRVRYEQFFRGDGLERRQRAIDEEGEGHMTRNVFATIISMIGVGSVFSLDTPHKYWLLAIPILSETYRFFNRYTTKKQIQSHEQTLAAYIQPRENKLPPLTEKA